MTTPTNTVPAGKPDKAKPEAVQAEPEKVTGMVVVPTRARHLTNAFDEDAEKEFRAQHEGKTLKNVVQVGKVQNIGTDITYHFEATV